MCVLISEPSLLGVKGFIGAVLVLLGAQAGGPGLLQGCSLCGSVKPVTPSLTPHSSVLSVTVNRPLLPGHTRHFGGKIFGAKISLSSCLLSLSVPVTPVSLCSSQRAACTFSSWTERGERFSVCCRYQICARPGPAEKHQNYLTKGVYAIGYIAKIFFRVLMMGIVSMFHLSAAA